MRISITPFTLPKFRFYLDSRFLVVLHQIIQDDVLNQIQSRFEELEIYVCANNEDKETQVKKITKRKNGKYWTFQIWFPYEKIVKDEKIDLTIFSQELMISLAKILNEYSLSDTLFDETFAKIRVVIQENNFDLTVKPVVKSLEQIAQKLKSEFDKKLV